MVGMDGAGYGFYKRIWVMFKVLVKFRVFFWDEAENK